MYRIRQQVPAELRHVIGKAELIQTLGTKDCREAKERAGAVIARFAARLEAARRELAGDNHPLTAREVAELAGEVYRGAVAQAEAESAGGLEQREAEQDLLLARLSGDHGDDVEDRRAFVPSPADLEEARTLLAERGKSTDAASLGRLADAFFGARTYAADLAVRRAAGDWQPDGNASRWPTAEQRPAQPAQPTAPAQDGAAVPFGELLDGFLREHPDQSAKTADKRRVAVDRFRAFAPHGDAAKVTKAEILAFKAARLDAGKTPKTVRNDLAMLQSVWGWAIRQGLLPGDNPFAGMLPRLRKGGPPKRLPFTDDDAAAILQAARGAAGFIRWLPWVLAFTGARLEEVCGAAKEDVRDVAGVTVLDIHPNRAGSTLKTAASQRMVPLHPALLAEGFLRYVHSLPTGSPLFPDLAPGFYGNRSEGATKRYGRWVRQHVKITDPAKAPAHSFRHRMADLLRFSGARQEAADALLGHDNPTNAGAAYGSGWRAHPEQLAPIVAKVPAPPGLVTEHDGSGSRRIIRSRANPGEAVAHDQGAGRWAIVADAPLAQRDAGRRGPHGRRKAGPAEV